MDDNAISVRQLGKCYSIFSHPKDRLRQALWHGRKKFFKEFWALRDVSFDVRQGETVGIIGRNGSGKSTLLQIVAGTLHPTEGEVQINGRVTALLELGSGFNPEFTGRENIFLNGSILGMTQREIRERLDEIVAFADIGDFVDQPVKFYSTGMFVRLAFAVVANLDARILIIDECLAVGDEKFQKKCFNLLEKIRRKGNSILFVSHSVETVEQICDRALLLEGGRILAQGVPKEVIDIYHINLYGNENVHLKNLNLSAEETRNENFAIQDLFFQNGGSGPNSMSDIAAQENGGFDSGKGLANGGKISWVRLFDHDGHERYVFQAHEYAEIAFLAEFHKPFDQILAGIKIRTLQGVKVYGTSNYYWQPVHQVKSGEQYLFRFRQNLRLCGQVYYLSVAVAERIGERDMRYIDKLADTVIFKILETPVRGDGLANLASEIIIEKV
jgi:lipopolysaccharide transport system ATP-binding protein